MSNTTVAPTPDTRTPAKTTTELIPTTNSTDSFTNGTVTTEITTTIKETTSQFPATTTNTTDQGEGLADNGDSGDVGAIVGGCIGGIIVVAIVIVVIFLVIRRRKRKKNSRRVPELPGADFLESIHQDKAIKYHKQLQENDNQTTKQYVNLTPEGDTDEQTDPSVGQDGYLKKNKHFLNIKKPKHKKHKKHQHHGQATSKAANGRSNETVPNEHPIYTNTEPNGKEPITRLNSVPYNEAPPPPRTDSPPPRTGSEYATGRIAGGFNSQDNDQEADSALNENYVNLSGQQKGEAVFSVQPPKKNNKSTSHNSDERKKKKIKVSGTDSKNSNKDEDNS
ncbi:uncharacterized protein LOC132714682, partial [Ruditapes philippinarum]|uniref:uncharacterized protein LOC132714682 n=1 Tax=Ruditapes philippinarum TaxID=129788 RepID=UPI00295A7EE3